jgi:hypothetical protein
MASRTWPRGFLEVVSTDFTRLDLTVCGADVKYSTEHIFRKRAWMGLLSRKLPQMQLGVIYQDSVYSLVRPHSRQDKASRNKWCTSLQCVKAVFGPRYTQ